MALSGSARCAALFAFALALIAPGAIAHAGEPLPESGAAKLAAYTVCRSAVILDMGSAGSNASAECTGIVKTADGAKAFDNLAIRCIEDSKARPEGYLFTGSCVQTDSDGDKLYMTYEGPEAGTLQWLGGTGKYDGVSAKGTWSVADAPGNTAQLFAFTLTMDATWERKAKAK